MHQLSNELTNKPAIQLRKPSAGSSSSGHSKARGRALGLFSVGLGLAETVAPGGVASLIGRMFTPRRSNRGRLLVGGAAVLGVAAVAAFSAARRNRGSALGRALAPIHVFKTITINRSPEEVYEYWRNLEKPDRPLALRQAITECKNGGIVSVSGVYGGFVDTFPMGAVVNRALTIRSGQCHAHRDLKPLLNRIELGQIGPSFVITHRLPLSEAAHGYELFHKKLDGCEKVVLKAA